MLTNPEISHMARYALGRINDPCAGQALHQALSRTSGHIKAGIINTLVQMDYVAASSAIKPLVNDQSKAVSIAAIRGAGHFGGRDSVKRLQKRANTFIVKVGDHGGGWNFQCELLQPDGAPIKGLTFRR